MAPTLGAHGMARRAQLAEYLVQVVLVVKIDGSRLQRCVLLRAPLFPVGEQVAEEDPSVRPRTLEGDRPVVEQLGQCGPADSEQVCGLLGGQCLGLRGHGQGLSRSAVVEAV